MRVIFEEVDGEYFFEIIFNSEDLEKFHEHASLIGDYAWEGNGVKYINVYIRKEKEKEQCHSLKEKKLVPKRGSRKTFAKKKKLIQKCRPNKL